MRFRFLTQDQSELFRRAQTGGKMSAFTLGAALFLEGAVAGPCAASPTLGGDSTGPQVHILQPAYNDVLKGKTRILVAVQVTKFDPQSIELYVDDHPATTGPIPLSSFPSSQFDWDTKQFIDGPHKLTVIVTDTQGFRGWAEVNVYINNGQIAETVPPQLAWANISQGQPLSGTVQIQLNAINRFGVKWIIVSVNPASDPNEKPPLRSWLLNRPPYSIDFDTTRVPDGSYVANGTAFDAFEQEGQAPTLNFSVNNTGAAINPTTLPANFGQDIIGASTVNSVASMSASAAQSAATGQTASASASKPVPPAPLPELDLPGVNVNISVPTSGGATGATNLAAPATGHLVATMPALPVAPRPVAAPRSVVAPASRVGAVSSGLIATTPYVPRTAAAPAVNAYGNPAATVWSGALKIATPVTAARVVAQAAAVPAKPTVAVPVLVKAMPPANWTANAGVRPQTVTAGALTRAGNGSAVDATAAWAPRTDPPSATARMIAATPVVTRIAPPALSMAVGPVADLSTASPSATDRPQLDAPYTEVASLPENEVPLAKPFLSEAPRADDGVVSVGVDKPVVVQETVNPVRRALLDAPAMRTRDAGPGGHAELSSVLEGSDAMLATSQGPLKVAAPTAIAELVPGQPAAEARDLAKYVPAALSASPVAMDTAESQATDLKVSEDAPVTSELRAAAPESQSREPYSPPAWSTLAVHNGSVISGGPKYVLPTVPADSTVQAAPDMPRLAALPRTDSSVPSGGVSGSITVAPLDATAQTVLPAFHTVERTTTLAAVAARYGLPVEVVAHCNNWPTEMKLVAGMKVKLPQELQVSYEGEPVRGDVSSLLVGSTTMTPFRFLWQQQGGSLDWNPQTQQVTARNKDQVVVLTIGSRVAQVNNKDVMLELAAFLMSGRTMVPVRLFEQGLHAQVDWDPSTGRMYVAMAN